MKHIKNLRIGQIREIAGLHCLDSLGFDGPEPLYECGECLVCSCEKYLIKKGEISE